MTCWRRARPTLSPPTTSCCPASSPRGADGKRFGIAGDYLSYEPYAIGFRRDDAGVRRAWSATALPAWRAKGLLNRLYTRWLVDRLPNGETLNVPMSPPLAEMYRALGQPD